MRKYPFRYDKGFVGQKVFLTLIDDDGIKSVDEDTIVEIQDNSYFITVGEDGEWLTDENGYVEERSNDWRNCSIGYWVEKYSPGHALYFGEDIFETKEEAEKVIANWRIV